ncbi:hypothetical protein SLEP1_g24983 [Rubroshorea leprosula]|uniref:Uncharacterized protein n=1 Tax=Rubroshorea leprosula TaxID=152421 RepID=A0AAV5JHM8_9ROSI|nr:hypothetical protein SLEP1_g24983 [Rubroshorea leprosula]
MQTRKMNYYEKLMKLVKPGVVLIYDNTLWQGTVVAYPEGAVFPEYKRKDRKLVMEFNRLISASVEWN